MWNNINYLAITWKKFENILQDALSKINVKLGDFEEVIYIS